MAERLPQTVAEWADLGVRTYGNVTLTREEMYAIATSPACKKCGHRMLFHQYVSGASTAVRCQVPAVDGPVGGTYGCECLTSEDNEG